MMMGFRVVTAVLVVGFGRLGDMFGRSWPQAAVRRSKR
jgi:hypothetical protein